MIAWRKAGELTRNIYQVTGKRDFARDFGLKNQIRRAAVSIMYNIAEGYDRSGRAEFHQFLVIAKGASKLYVAHDINYLDPPRFERLKHDTEKLSRILTGLKKASKNKETKNDPHLYPLLNGLKNIKLLFSGSEIAVQGWIWA